MRRIAYTAALAVLCAGIAGAAPAGLWVQVWSYDMPGEAEYYESLAAAFNSQPGDGPTRIELGTWDVAHDQIGEWFKGSTGPDLVGGRGILRCPGQVHHQQRGGREGLAVLLRPGEQVPRDPAGTHDVEP